MWRDKEEMSGKGSEKGCEKERDSKTENIFLKRSCWKKR